MTLIKKAWQIVALATVALSFTAFASSVAERIAPVGKTCMTGDNCAATVVAAADTGPRSGQTVYETNCVACHATGVAAAPILGAVDEWAVRLEDKGMDGLYESAWNGINGMPAKGLCMDCTREELDAAVDYMVENSK